jgi:hypothetical protein
MAGRLFHVLALLPRKPPLPQGEGWGVGIKEGILFLAMTTGQNFLRE